MGAGEVLEGEEYGAEGDEDVEDERREVSPEGIIDEADGEAGEDDDEKSERDKGQRAAGGGEGGPEFEAKE